MVSASLLFDRSNKRHTSSHDIQGNSQEVVSVVQGDLAACDVDTKAMLYDTHEGWAEECKQSIPVGDVATAGAPPPPLRQL